MNQPKNEYDVIVIGSGVSGLSTATFLAKVGKKVAVFEQHSVVGGFTHTFRRRGFEWDIGFHYVGQMQDKNNLKRKVLHYISGGRIEWNFTGPVYDQIVFPQRRFSLPAGRNNLVKYWIEQFPEERRSLERYIRLIEKVVNSANYYFMRRLVPKPIGFLFGRLFYRYSQKTTKEVLDELFDSKMLKAALAGQYGNYGLPPAKSSFAMHALVIQAYLEGGFYPTSGSASIAREIIEEFKKFNGEIFKNTEVAEIIVENKVCRGIRLKSGKEIKAKKVVSSCGYQTTYKKFLQLDIDQQLKLSCSHVGLYLGLSASPEQLKLPKYNMWVYEEPDGEVIDHDSALENFYQDSTRPFPVVFLSFSTSKDPAWRERCKGATIEAIIPMNRELMGGWQRKDPEYLEFKEQMQRRLLEVVLRHFPQVSDHIVHSEISTPLTTKRFMKNSGEIYGIENTPERFRNKNLHVMTPISGVYLTGQDLVCDGVAASAVSGWLTAMGVMKRPLIRPFL